MKPIAEVNREPISFKLGPLTQAQLEQFRSATHTEFSSGFPPTYPTTLRKAEFEFLDRFEVDMRQLLHVDQEYSYLKPLKIGDELTVTTCVGDAKVRAGMCFVKLQTDVASNGEPRVQSSTTFVVKVTA